MVVSEGVSAKEERWSGQNLESLLFQAEDGMRDQRRWREFGRVLSEPALRK